ncbi:MAG: lipid-A-disaccharide synthase [Phormidesmis sp.]
MSASATAGTIDGPVDIVILSNGPGEVATWVKPVVRSLRTAIKKSRSKKPSKASNFRISVILAPCPHASGQEHTTVERYPEVDRVQSAAHFFKFLLTGKTADSWDWSSQGIVVFLGGDQFYTVLLAKRLGYRSLTYAEWDARWPSQIDRFGVMQPELVKKAPARYQHKFAVVGDLMADVQTTGDRTTVMAALGISPKTELVGFLPGSKPTKLSPGMPLSLTIAQTLHTQRPNTHYVIGVAPNLTLNDLVSYSKSENNPLVPILQSPSATLVEPETGLPYLQIEDGPKLFLWQRFPALDVFSQCALCITTIGANTAQLGALAIPMIVLLPTQQFDGLKLWDGIPGLLARLPGIKPLARKFINPIIIKTLQKTDKLFAWPNIWAKREVVPELLGPITAAQVSDLAHDYLAHPEKLTAMGQTLRDLRGPAGAADKMAALILETVNYPK